MINYTWQFLVGMCRWPFAALLCILFISGAFSLAPAQSISFDRAQGRMMLNAVKEDISKNYYDPTFRGIDLDSRFSKAEQQINQATSFTQILGIIAQTLVDFDDSHTFFIPPASSNRV